MKPADRKTKIAVVVGTVTNDVRVFDIPKLTVRQTIADIFIGHFISLLRSVHCGSQKVLVLVFSRPAVKCSCLIS